MELRSKANRNVRKKMRYEIVSEIYLEVTKMQNGQKGRLLALKPGNYVRTRGIKSFVVMNKADSLKKIHKDLIELTKSRSKP